MPETPPHTWRKYTPLDFKRFFTRNTSTYVEKIDDVEPAHEWLQKHLHIRGENSSLTTTLPIIQETPPHTWRKYRLGRSNCAAWRNTSTYVEKISPLKKLSAFLQKHLHIRGENTSATFSSVGIPETPPHTWRKFGLGFVGGQSVRNTSTYVEKICARFPRGAKSQKHLHIRGENSIVTLAALMTTETPPHTWRKCCRPISGKWPNGNTSTYVEKIEKGDGPDDISKKHLHIRGENDDVGAAIGDEAETPPHTWRKSIRRISLRSEYGNTSTYVEKMINAVYFDVLFQETPPHTWRKSESHHQPRLDCRNTSTYVEKIHQSGCLASHRQKHLHIRGENPFMDGLYVSYQETPPHTWRKFRNGSLACFGKGNTSTYVEKILFQLAKNLANLKHLHIRGENVNAQAIATYNQETPPHTWRKY